MWVARAERVSRGGLAPLPVATRCYDGEDLASWAGRHTTRNHTSVYAVEKALRNRGLLHGHALRDPERLERWRQLGDLHPSAFTTPTHLHGTWVTSRDLCLRCTQGHPATGRLPHHGWVCLRHHRWTDPPRQPVADPIRRPRSNGPDGTKGLQDAGPGLPAIVVAAERVFRRDLAPRGVLVDSPLMLFALDLAHLTHPAPAPANESTSQHRPDDDLRGVRYATQVRWARTLADPTVRSGLTDPAPKTRASTIENTIDDVVDVVTGASEPGRQRHSTTSAVEVWRIRHRLWRFSARLTADLLTTDLLTADLLTADLLTTDPGAAVTGFEVPLGSAGVA